jgi:hypothetical protein
MLFTANLFKERDDWQERLMTFKQFKVIKYPRIFQSLFYLLKYRREDICWLHTNKLWWMEAKKRIDSDLIMGLVHYKVFKPKNDEYTLYQTINFVEKNIAGINHEEVEAYS